MKLFLGGRPPASIFDFCHVHLQWVVWYSIGMIVEESAGRAYCGCVLSVAPSREFSKGILEIDGKKALSLFVQSGQLNSNSLFYSCIRRFDC